MCLVRECKENHRCHFCKVCNNTNSDHFSSHCPHAQMRPKARHCRVKGCQENHPEHYCKICRDHDSNHFASECPNGIAFNSGVRAHHIGKPNRGYHPRDNGDIIGHRQTLIHELENKRRDNDAYQRRYDANKKSCRVRGCKQFHDSHFCKNCNDPNSDHFSSECPHKRTQKQRQPIFSPANQQRFDHMKRSRSKEARTENNHGHRSSTTPKDPQRESPSKHYRNPREQNIYLAQGDRINEDYSGLGTRGGNEARQGSLQEAPWAKMVGNKGFFT